MCDNGDDVQRKFLETQMGWYLETYRHHYRMFITVSTIYLLIVGTAAGFVFGETVPPKSRIPLCIFVATISLIFGTMCLLVARGWFCLVQTRIRDICHQLNIGHFPLVGVKTVYMAVVVCVVFLSFSVAVALLFA